ncbi:MAG TPA: hypothetical protein VFA89_23845 [Terriglobales bacterium]|nr:hypothetical protein [Terriglobales bacterium]
MFPSSGGAKLSFCVLLVAIVTSQSLAQGPSPNAAPPAEAAAFVAPVSETPHAFWDKPNKILFTLVGMSSAADFAVTHYNLGNGGRELNPVANVFVGNTAGQAANFIGGALGTMGVSYVFHKTGHHRMERVTSMVQIGGSTFAAAYGLTHR